MLGGNGLGIATTNWLGKGMAACGSAGTIAKEVYEMRLLGINFDAS